MNLGVQIYALDNFTTHSPFGSLFDSNTLGMYAMAVTLLQVTLLVDAQFAKWRAWLLVGHGCHFDCGGVEFDARRLDRAGGLDRIGIVV